MKKTAIKTFKICTIANNMSLYEQMKVSFIKAGFSEEFCNYLLLDNSDGNVHDPFRSINSVISETYEPYIIFCHQDILVNKNHGYKHLMAMLEQLSKIDSDWALAGNAGVNQQYEFVAIISDSVSPNWQGELPQKVHSLDENFFVIKTSLNLNTSTDLSGFHFYATDLCLNAILDGKSCYVIDFHVTHLSSGNYSEAFFKARDEFYNYWSNKFYFTYVMTPCTSMMPMSRFNLLRYIGSQSKILDFFHRYRHLLYFLSPYRYSKRK